MYLENILSPICTVFPDIEFYKFGLTIKEKTKFSFYDSLIIAAAKIAKCKILFSEDMQDGYTFENLTITNPFVNY